MKPSMRVAVVGPAGPTLRPDRIDRADVVDHAVGEVHRQRFALASMSWMRLCAASRPVSIFPLSSRVSPGFQLATSAGVRGCRD